MNLHDIKEKAREEIRKAMFSSKWSDMNKAIDANIDRTAIAVLDMVEKHLEVERWSYHDMGEDSRREIPIEEVNELCLKSHNGLLDNVMPVLAALRAEITEKSV